MGSENNKEPREIGRKPSRVADRFVGAVVGSVDLSDLAERWRSLSLDERTAVLHQWIAVWRMSIERPEAQPAAVTTVDARRTMSVEVGGKKIPAHVGPTLHRPTITYAEQGAYVEAKEEVEAAAQLVRELAFQLRLDAAGRESDERIVFSPAPPDRAEAVQATRELREVVAATVRRCLTQTGVYRAADLLWYVRDDRTAPDLVVDDVRGGDPAYLEGLAVRLGLIARLLADLSKTAPGTKPRTPSKKENVATKTLLANLGQLGLDKAAFAEVKREVATMLVYGLNLRFSSGSAAPLFNLQAESCDRCGKDLLKPAWRCPDDACQKRLDADREERRKDAVGNWLKHFLDLAASKRRLRSV